MVIWWRTAARPGASNRSVRTVTFALALSLIGAPAPAEPPPAPKASPRGAGLAAARKEPQPIAQAPAPPKTTAYLDVGCRWTRGQLTVADVTPGRFAAPTAIKRYTGRFEARVTSRGKLLDALRFDFPLLGDADSGNQAELAETLKKNLSTQTRVRVPLPDGADKVVLVDLHGGATVEVPLGSLTSGSEPRAAGSGLPPPGGAPAKAKGASARDAGGGAPRPR
jgi:hypothetical protein